MRFASKPARLKRRDEGWEAVQQDIELEQRVTDTAGCTLGAFARKDQRGDGGVGRGMEDAQKKGKCEVC